MPLLLSPMDLISDPFVGSPLRRTRRFAITSSNLQLIGLDPANTLVPSPTPRSQSDCKNEVLDSIYSRKLLSLRDTIIAIYPLSKTIHAQGTDKWILSFQKDKDKSNYRSYCFNYCYQTQKTNNISSSSGELL